MSDRVSRLAKMLASDSPKTRKLGHRCVCQIFQLKLSPTARQLTYKEILGICKGLYYSLWMQDKLLLQEDTVSRIVKLVSIIASRELRINFVTAMFETLAREWDNLDIWRTDKFLMLIRDFFIKVLMCSKKRTIPTKTLTNAVYGKLLNTDATSAVDLKVHMCSLIKQELKAKKNIGLIINSFFRRTLEVVSRIPKGSDYSTQMIQLLLCLAKLIRRNRSLPRRELSEEVLLLSGKILAYKKIFRRIAKILYIVPGKLSDESQPTAEKSIMVKNHMLDFHEKLNGELKDKPRLTTRKQKRVKKIVPKINSILTSLDVPLDGDSSGHGVIQNTSSVCQHLDRKRSHPEEDTMNGEKDISEQNLSPNISDNNTEHSPAKKRRRRNKKSTISKANQDLSDAENKSSLLSELESNAAFEIGVVEVDSFSSPISSPINISTPCGEGDKAISDSLIEDVVPSKKRVSFGKVFRKKFLSNRVLSLKTANISSSPNRGILRH